MREKTRDIALLAVLLSLGNWAGNCALVDAAPGGSAVAIIVNKQNSVDDLSLADLRKILLADKTKWPNNEKVTVVMLATSAEREVVLHSICKMSSSDFNKYYLHLIFTGGVTSGPISFGTPEEVRGFVASTAGAIGYIPSDETGGASKIKVIRVGGQLPGDGRYEIK